MRERREEIKYMKRGFIKRQEFILTGSNVCWVELLTFTDCVARMKCMSTQKNLQYDTSYTFKCIFQIYSQFSPVVILLLQTEIKHHYCSFEFLF